MMRILFIAVLILLILIVCLLPLGIGWGVAALQRSSAWWTISWRAAGCAASAAVVAALCYGLLRGPDRLVTTSYTYAHCEVPPNFDGYRIVQLSDWHVGTFASRRERVERVVERVNALKPDLIVFTGDLVNHSAEEAEAFEDVLSRLRAADGVVSVMGNHDYMMYNPQFSTRERRANVERLQQLQRRMGWRLLLNGHVCIHRGADSIVIAGTESNGNGLKVSHYERLLKKSYEGVSPQGFHVLLSHYPTYWRSHVLPQSPAILQLAGHTHAMQFQIGGWSPAAWMYDEWYGLYDAKHTDADHDADHDADAVSGATGRHSQRRSLIVSRGVGSVGLAFRLGAWPEVVEIRLKRV